MPIYEYRCGTCGRRVEVLVRSSTGTPVCPDCDTPLTDKLFSVPNILSGLAPHPPRRPCCEDEERCAEAPCFADGVCRQD